MDETTKLLVRALDHIKALKKTNSLMAARLEMFDAIQNMLHTRLAFDKVDVTQDLSYEIEKHLESKSSEQS